MKSKNTAGIITVALQSIFIVLMLVNIGYCLCTLQMKMFFTTIYNSVFGSFANYFKTGNQYDLVVFLILLIFLIALTTITAYALLKDESTMTEWIFVLNGVVYLSDLFIETDMIMLMPKFFFFNFIIDGAHNRDGAKVLADSVRQYFPKKKLHYIMGVFKDKEYETIIAQMSAFDADVITVETPGNPRALPAEELAEAWKKKKADVTFEKKIENAVRKSLEKAKKDDVILAFGSLSFLGEIVKALDTIRSEV